MNFDVVKNLQNISGEADWVGLRYVNQKSTNRVVRDGNPETNSLELEHGAMVEVLVNGQFGYAGTSDLSASGIKKAAKRARVLAEQCSQFKLCHFDHSLREKASGSFRSPRKMELDSISVKEITDLLVEITEKLNISDKIISRTASANTVEAVYSFSSTSGSDIHQDFCKVGLGISAAAKEGSETQIRSERDGLFLQTGAEAFDRELLFGRAQTIAEQALELVVAEDCPTLATTLVLDPGQMILQIHESVGHPLEVDRILGDERNYAGWSFIREKDFGQLQYGSELMNISFDPTLSGEFASYAFDDSGTRAEKQYIIEKGKLLRGLGGAESQRRSGIAGVANSRAQSWNRPPLDRMGNINLEPGSSSLEDMISDVEYGVYMETNRSWSIDDYRKKFQFGCEYAKLIENGKFTKTLKNPNYRDVTSEFWHKLDRVGDKSTFAVYGTPYCGKAEPNQVIRVGHASPTCRFNQVEVFGGSK